MTSKANPSAGKVQHEVWFAMGAIAVAAILVAKYLENHNTHLMKSTSAELWIGIILYGFASMLLWDCYVQRGKSAPWPLGVVTPF